jgi:Ion channel
MPLVLRIRFFADCAWPESRRRASAAGDGDGESRKLPAGTAVESDPGFALDGRPGVLSVIVSLALLLLLTTLIHYESLRLLSAGLPRLRIPARSKLVVVILGTFCAHAAEMLLYAVAFWVLSGYFGAGNLGSTGNASFAASLYFSAETYTSLGYGDVVPSGDLRLLAGAEALNGLLLIGWSASYIYLSMERLWHELTRGP